MVCERTTHIVLLGQAKKLPNLGRPLRPQPLGLHLVRETRNILVTLLDNRQRKHRQIHGHDAPPHTLPLPLSSAARAVTAVSLTEQQPYTSRVHAPLLHGKALLVVTAGDAEGVALEFVADAVARDLLAHATVDEDTQLTLLLDFDELLCAIGGVRDVELHLGDFVKRAMCVRSEMVGL